MVAATSRAPVMIRHASVTTSSILMLHRWGPTMHRQWCLRRMCRVLQEGGLSAASRRMWKACSRLLLSLRALRQTMQSR